MVKNNCNVYNKLNYFVEYVSVVTKTDELQVDSSVPEDGEFALVIKAKGVSDSDFKPVCYYLLTTLENEEKSMYIILI